MELGASIGSPTRRITSQSARRAFRHFDDAIARANDSHDGLG
jgi:hypothetical protein